MPPITRNHSKKVSTRHKPYSEINSKENGPLIKRTALLDIIPNNDVLAVIKNDIKETEKQIDNAKQLCNNYKPSVTLSSSDNTNLSLNVTKESTFYQSTNEELICSNELYHTAIHNTLSTTNSELYYSTVDQLSINCNEDEIFEIDQTNWNNFMYVGCYARDIFNYLRQREDQYIINDYISNQSELTHRHRAIVVNWLVNLQDLFELNHEVLYMAVKLIDLYLMKHDTSKKKFQLLAASALLLSSKIEIREPGLPQDLCKEMNIYTEEDLLVTERELAKSLNFDINVPLSYVFLRRFARCMKCQMVLLTLARYILECSLLGYNFVTTRDSLKAASSLYLAFKMNFKSVDPNEFQKYTGYTLKQIKDTVLELNNMLHTLSPDLSSIKQKYTHEAFYRVTSKPLLPNSKLTFD